MKHFWNFHKNYIENQCESDWMRNKKAESSFMEADSYGPKSWKSLLKPWNHYYTIWKFPQGPKMVSRESSFISLLQAIHLCHFHSQLIRASPWHSIHGHLGCFAGWDCHIPSRSNFWVAPESSIFTHRPCSSEYLEMWVIRCQSRRPSYPFGYQSVADTLYPKISCRYILTIHVVWYGALSCMNQWLPN